MKAEEIQELMENKIVASDELEIYMMCVLSSQKVLAAVDKTKCALAVEAFQVVLDALEGQVSSADVLAALSYVKTHAFLSVLKPETVGDIRNIARKFILDNAENMNKLQEREKELKTDPMFR